MSALILDLEKLNAKDPKVKYGFVKELLRIAQEHPGALYANFDRWVEMMQHTNNIFKWTAIDVIGYLSAVDTENKTAAQIDALVVHLHGGKLIATNHAIFALGLIAQHKPHHRERILRELTKVAHDDFDSDECREIAIGKVILTLGGFMDAVLNNPEFIDFVVQAKHSGRNATRKKAELFMKKIHASRLKA